MHLPTCEVEVLGDLCAGLSGPDDENGAGWQLIRCEVLL
ncbi:Uncharacterised protein [Mycobacteroides abscessus subsp. abscessus]|nr:Uncharacterised protein [Mycobacteroides abscessus subsp. abscessus]